MRFVIVKRGAHSAFRFLEQSCKDVAGLRVIWDRRRGRQDQQGDMNLGAGDRRVENRRRPAPHSWTAADHVLADGPDTEDIETPANAGAFEAQQGGRTI